MTDFEFIMAESRRYYHTGWNDDELKTCLELLPSLTREELMRLYRSQWVDGTLRKEVFQVLFADKIGKREERVKNMPTDELIEEFKDKKSGNLALIRKELRERYKADENGDRLKIFDIFSVSTKADQQWVVSQKRKELSESAKGTWPSPPWKR
jgi:hypothetical protein